MEWCLEDQPIQPSPECESVKTTLGQLKNEIPSIKLFSVASKFVNPGEYLKSEHRVISRAYFKMLEILKRYLSPHERVKALFLCEAPGAFQQATADWLKDKLLDWHAVTLPDSIKWTGDPSKVLFQDVITQPLPDTLQVNLVTGDGGFEADPSKQEIENYTLFEAQMLRGLDRLMPEGTLVVKFFDMFEANTQALLIEMTRRFDKAYILKPWGSRICNSERYFIGLRKRLIPKVTSVSLARLQQIIVEFAKVQIEALEYAFKLAKTPGITEDILRHSTRTHLDIGKSFDRITRK